MDKITVSLAFGVEASELPLGQSPALTDVLQDLQRDGRVGPRIFLRLIEELPVLRGADKQMLGKREDRVRFYQSVIRELSDGPGDVLVREFAAGLLLASVGNGSFEHLSVANGLVETMPRAIIWFGICAALFVEGNLGTFKGGIGRRLARDDARAVDFFSRPQADIGAAEFELIFKRQDAASDLPVVDADRLSLELLPGVETLLISASNRGDRVGSAALRSEEVRELQFLLDRARRLLSEAGRPRQQRELFRSDTRYRRGKSASQD